MIDFFPRVLMGQELKPHQKNQISAFKRLWSYLVVSGPEV